MAGESPDRSEQRKSSGETIRGERDPRLTDRREAEETPGSAPAREGAARTAARAPGVNGRAEAPGGASKPSSGASERSGGPERRSGGDGAKRGASGVPARRGGATGARADAEPESDQREPAGRERSGDQATAVFTAIRRTPGQASGEPGASSDPGGNAGRATAGAAGSGGSAKVRDSESDAADEGAGGARDEADDDGTSGSAADGEDRVTTVLRTGPLPTRPGADWSATDAAPADDGATDGDADADADGEGDEGTDGGSAAASVSHTSDSTSALSSTSDAEADDADASASSVTGDGPAVPVGDARLRAAVAAWVAKAGPDDREEAPGDGRSDADARTDSVTPADAAGAADRGKGKGSDKGKGDSAATPAGAGAAASGSAADASSSASDDDSVSGSASGSGGVPGTPADRATAVFGAVHGAAAARATRDGDGGTKPSGGKGSGTTASDGEAAGGKSAGGKDGKNGKDDSAKATGADRTTGADGAGRTDATGRAAASVDTPTSVFGTLRPREAGDAPAGERAGARPGKGEDKAESKDEGKTAGKDAADEAKGKGAGKGVGPAGDAVDRPTTAFKALRPSDLPRDAGATAGGKGKGKGAGRGQEPASAERTSQFVPLKSADERPAKPAAGARPAAAAGAGTPPVTERTAQQPVLDLPAGAATGATATGATPTGESERPAGPPAPLDLLAQLTNTPPPKPTLTRTIVRRVKIWTPVVLVLAILFGVAQSLRPLPTPELKLTANSSFSFDGAKPTMPWPGKGQAVVDVEGLGSLGAYGEQKPAPIASVAKVMTAYVIMRDHPMKAGTDGPKIKIDAKAAADAGKDADGESVVKVDEGAQITQREAIESIMIASANNIARLLARWDAGSEAAFVTKMNEAAKDLGMKNTTYTDPSGLNATTVSTAVDQVKLAKKAMDDPVFREVVKMPNYEDSRGDVHGNWNHLVPFNGVVGIKTGTTTKAGGNLVFAAEKKIGGTTQLIIGAVLSQPPAERDNSILTGALDASKKLILKAQDTLQAHKVVKKGDVVGEVDDGLGGKTPVVAVKDVTAVGWPGLTVNLDLTDGGKKLPHTQDAGTEIGTLTVGQGPGQVKVPVALGEDLAEPSFGTKLLRVT